MDKRLLEILTNKPAIVFDLPEWMLPASTVKEIRDTGNTAIAEIAGRDSIAAAIRACETLPIKAIVPTIVYTGTEFGDWEILLKKIAFLKERFKKYGIKVFDPVFLGDPRLWNVLCGRLATHLFKRFGFYTPCTGCHLYIHAIRVPLAKMLNCTMVIGGEREAHNGRIKINQVNIALDSYTQLLKKFDIELILPLRPIDSGQTIADIIGSGYEDRRQLECVMSKNYQEIDGTVSYNHMALRRFFDEFALKIAERAVRSYLEKKTPDYARLIAQYQD
ncbi:MAG: hypothetical protein AB1487_01495 [Thermodesulfobacteriota bacterium]